MRIIIFFVIAFAAAFPDVGKTHHTALENEPLKGIAKLGDVHKVCRERESNPNAETMCIAYVAGTIDALTYAHASCPFDREGFSIEAVLEDMMRYVSIYLPGFSDAPAAFAVSQWFVATYPCED